MKTMVELTNLKKKASDLRDQSIQAKATMKEVDINIENEEKELKSLGIKDIEKADEEIEGFEKQAEDLYNEAYSKIEKWI